MRVFYDLNNLAIFRNAVVTIGSFDGVHLGHQKIIEQLKIEAAAIGGESVIITFHPHPRKILSSHKNPLFLLNTLAEKLHLLEKYGVENVVVAPFTEDFASQTAEKYVQFFLVKKFHPHTIIVGHDHRFGKDRTGDYHTLETYGEVLNFQVKEIPEKVVDEVGISSTKIREALQAGDVETANQFLGYPYFFEGTVVKGNQLGRTIGFPTANLCIEDADKLIPAVGSYAVKVFIKEKRFDGMLNIGTRPTIEANSTLSIEVNIFDFDKNIYGEKIGVELIAHLRSERKFMNIMELMEQLVKDKTRVVSVLTSSNL